MRILRRFQTSLARFVGMSDSENHRSVGAQVIQFISSWLLRDWKVAVLAIFASLLLTPRTSEATCGDYLTGNGHSGSMRHVMTDELAVAHDGIFQLLHQRGPRPPCHGPGCSQHSLPRQMQVPMIVVSLEQWALVFAVNSPTVVASENLPADRPEFVGDGYRLSILRPPR